MNQSLFVLHIDDDPDDLLVFREAIDQVDQEVTLHQEAEAASALRFLRSFKNPCERPGLVVVDLNMPGISGKEFIALIRNDEELNALNLVAFTTSSLASDREYCARFGVSCITKPSIFTEVIRTLNRMLQLSSNNRSAY